MSEAALINQTIYFFELKKQKNEKAETSNALIIRQLCKYGAGRIKL